MRFTYPVRNLAGVAALLAATVAYAGAPRPLEQAEGGSTRTLAEARKYLEGRWALESFEVRPPGRRRS